MGLKVALVGNPNVGKTSLYNRITHSFEHVGNWHGVTVGSVERTIAFESETVTLTDLPGLYSLSVYSLEEGISRDKIIGGDCDIIINVCEANNLQRNLYLSLQLVELGAPFVLAVNMIDELKKQGKVFDGSRIERTLGVKVVPTSAKSRNDCIDLMSAAKSAASLRHSRVHLPYLKKIPLDKVERIISDNLKDCGMDRTWACLKVLENDRYVSDRLNLTDTQLERIAELGDWQEKIAQYRHEYIDRLTEGTVKQISCKQTDVHGFGVMDKVLLNKYLALPIFFLIMAAVFFLTFGLIGKLLSDLLQMFMDKCIGAPIAGLLIGSGAPEWITALICEGIIGGVGGIIVFLPQIVLLFFFLAMLEDSGYISRVAFMTDGLFRKIGLSGRSVFTMLMGFGCSATAVLTARGLADENIRKKTVLLTPFMSCSARLPVYAAVAGAFFSKGRPLIIFGLYMLGVIVSVCLAALFERFTKKFKSGKSSFIMEMPPYRIPTVERVGQLIFDNIKVFLIRVGTVIFALNVIIWILSHFSLGFGFSADGSGSILQAVAGIIAPMFKPLGFGNWRAVTSLLSGIVAKEIVITSLQSLGGVSAVFVGEYVTAAAAAFMSFTLLYTPCAATLGAVKKELGGKYALISFIMQTLVAYAVSLCVYWLGVLFIILPSVAWVIISVLAAVAFGSAVFFVLKNRKRRRCGNKCCGCNTCGRTIDG